LSSGPQKRHCEEPAGDEAISRHNATPKNVIARNEVTKQSVPVRNPALGGLDCRGRCGGLAMTRARGARPLIRHCERSEAICPRT
jgi:hypothetical protein